MYDLCSLSLPNITKQERNVICKNFFLLKKYILLRKEALQKEQQIRYPAERKGKQNKKYKKKERWTNHISTPIKDNEEDVRVFPISLSTKGSQKCLLPKWGCPTENAPQKSANFFLSKMSKNQQVYPATMVWFFP